MEPSMNYLEHYNSVQREVNHGMNLWIQSYGDSGGTLNPAVRRAVLGGHRTRPILVHLSAEIAGAKDIERFKTVRAASRTCA